MPSSLISYVIHLLVAVSTAIFALSPGSTFAFQGMGQPPPGDDFLIHRPNELGRVPVFMYHNIVPEGAPRDSSVDPYMYRTYEEFWSDMLWLYNHDFYLIGMNDLVSGNIDIPIGKHPVVFTFDDSSSFHFSIIEHPDGRIEVDPNCAVGLMESFYAKYPDFGRGAHFGLVPAHKFSWPEHEQDEYFDWKIEFLMANGYEVGNHTLNHPNLNAIDDEEFMWTVSGAVIWADATMGADHPSNATRVLTLPFGIRPTKEANPGKVAMIRDGFTYEGHDVRLIGVLELTGGSSEVPWSNEWDAFAIPRLPLQDDVFDMFKDVHLDGKNPYFTSDGDPETVVVPWPLPEAQWGKLNKEAIEAAGKVMVKYDPDTGHIKTFAVHIPCQIVRRDCDRLTFAA